MHPGIEAFRRFRVDIALADHAAERRLDMRAGAAEAVVKVEMAEGGVEVVPPQQADHPAAEPDAFRIAGRAGDQAGRLGELVDLALGVLGGSAGWAAGGLSAALASPLWAKARLARRLRHRRKNAARLTRNKKDIGWPVGLGSLLSRPLALSGHRLGPICGSAPPRTVG